MFKVTFTGYVALSKSVIQHPEHNTGVPATSGKSQTERGSGHISVEYTNNTKTEMSVYHNSVSIGVSHSQLH